MFQDACSKLEIPREVKRRQYSPSLNFFRENPPMQIALLLASLFHALD